MGLTQLIALGAGDYEMERDFTDFTDSPLVKPRACHPDPPKSKRPKMALGFRGVPGDPVYISLEVKSVNR